MQDIEVLIVDDSAVVRKVLSRVLDAADGVHVMGVAQHPLIAMERMKRQQPDVIVLDIEMPHMDGLTFLRRIMAEDPIPVVICSVQTSAGSEAAMQALRAGAVEVVAKPTRGIQDFLANSAPELVAAVRAAAQARLRGHQHIVAPAPAEMPVHTPVPRRDRGRPPLVAIGLSTGGTQAIEHVLRQLDGHGPGIVVVQHMPEQFTRAFAERLDTVTPVRVREAADGDRVTSGEVLIARGGHQLRVEADARGYRVRVSDDGPVNGHRPSVDVLFHSVADCMGDGSLGIILTGMGADGAAGLLEMRRAGATTVAQDEASCVVYGMPAAAVRLGAVDYSSGLDGIAAAINGLAERAGARPSGPTTRQRHFG